MATPSSSRSRKTPARSAFRSTFSTGVRFPPGCAASCEEIAARIDDPGAVRTVGNALARNPVAFLIPCHWGIRTTGAIGGISGGPAH